MKVKEVKKVIDAKAMGSKVNFSSGNAKSARENLAKFHNVFIINGGEKAVSRTEIKKLREEVEKLNNIRACLLSSETMSRMLASEDLTESDIVPYFIIVEAKGKKVRCGSENATIDINEKLKQVFSAISEQEKIIDKAESVYAKIRTSVIDMLPTDTTSLFEGTHKGKCSYIAKTLEAFGFDNVKESDPYIVALATNLNTIQSLNFGSKQSLRLSSMTKDKSTKKVIDDLVKLICQSLADSKVISTTRANREVLRMLGYNEDGSKLTK